MISGCMPEKCHYIKGNLGARRQLDEFARLLAYLGMQPERVRFVWMDVSERGRIQQEVADFEAQLAALGPSEKFAAINAGGERRRQIWPILMPCVRKSHAYYPRKS